MSAPINPYQESKFLDKLQAHVNEDVESLVAAEHRVAEEIGERVRELPNQVGHMTSEQIQDAIHSVEAAYKKRMHKKKRRAQWLAIGGITFWLLAVCVLAVAIMPRVVYGLFPESADRIAQSLGETVDVEKSGFGETIYEAEKEPEPQYVPPYDPTLPEVNHIYIDSIGLTTDIGEGEDWEEVLRTGVWRTPDFGTPEDRRRPMILAAHRFGYLVWTNQYRRENSFYNLPKLENGDKIEVVWNQRKYIYEVYEGYTDTALRDFEADLILFTCEVLNSDRRIVRKARLIVPDGFAKELR
jgi:sortase (surface protein transpeptidase)